MSKTTTEQAKLKRLGNAIEAVFPVPGGATIKQDRGLKHLKILVSHLFYYASNQALSLFRY